MRLRTLVFPALLVAVTGCANAHHDTEGHQKLVHERDEYQAQYEGATTRNADLERQAKDAKAEAEKARQDATAAQSDHDKLEAAVKDADAKAQAAAKDLASERAKNQDTEKQITAESDKEKALRQQVDSLQKELQILTADLTKARAAAGDASPSTKSE